MEFIYEGKNIIDEVDLSSVIFTEQLGGKLDDLKLTFSDNQKLWSKWKPKKGDALQFKGIQDSGKMLVDSIVMKRGQLTLKALPIESKFKSIRRKSFEKITLLALAERVAADYNLRLVTYNVPEILYKRIDSQQTSLQFLAERALLEGVQVKVHQGKLILYSMAYLEAQSIQETISMTDFPDYEFLDTDQYSLGGCVVRFGHIYGSAGVDTGRVVEIDLKVENQLMANRYASNYLKAENDKAVSLIVRGQLSKKLYPGMKVAVEDYGLPDGKYLILSRVTNLIGGHSTINMRRVAL